MDEDLAPRVEWLFRNLECQLEDVDFQSAGVEICTFLDNSDVHNAVLGLDAYYTGAHFELDKFRHPRALVAALADSGWLGSFQMLQSHQDEFLGLLKRDFDVPRDDNLERRAQQFLDSVGVRGELARLPVNLHSLSDETLTTLLRDQAGSAVTFFKALQCVRGDWRTRLARWRRKNVLSLQNVRIEYSKLLEAPHFTKIKAAFDTLRPKKTVSNFADAIALCLLAQEIDNFKSLGERVPRFFLSSDLFSQVIRESQTAHLFRYRNPDGGESTAFRHTDYFIFRATFLSRPEAPGVDASAAASPNELRVLRDEIRELRTSERVTHETISSIALRGKPLSDLIKDLSDFYFLENVWLPSGASVDVRRAGRELVEAARLFHGSEKIRNRIQAEVESVREQLTNNVQQYQEVKALWHVLERRAAEASGRIPSMSRNLFVYYGLLRFGFSAVTAERVVEALQHLFSGDEDSERAVIIRVVRAWYGRPASGSETADDIPLAAAILWSINEYKTLWNGLTQDRVWAHWSKKVLTAASGFQLCDSSRRREVAKRLVRELAAEYRKQEDSALGIALGYLLFHQWLCDGHVAVYRPERTGINKLDDRLVRAAVDYARDACRGFAESDVRHVYSLNQQLYYATEGVLDLDSALDHAAVAVKLADYKGDRKLWEYRYDDTLARYFYRMAIATRDKGRRADLLKTAKMHSNWAYEGSGGGDLEVREFLTFLAARELWLEKEAQDA